MQAFHFYTEKNLFLEYCLHILGKHTDGNEKETTEGLTNLRALAAAYATSSSDEDDTNDQNRKQKGKAILPLVFLMQHRLSGLVDRILCKRRHASFFRM